MHIFVGLHILSDEDLWVNKEHNSEYEQTLTNRHTNFIRLFDAKSRIRRICLIE